MRNIKKMKGNEIRRKERERKGKENNKRTAKVKRQNETEAL